MQNVCRTNEKRTRSDGVTCTAYALRVVSDWIFILALSTCFEVCLLQDVLQFLSHHCIKFQCCISWHLTGCSVSYITLHINTCRKQQCTCIEWLYATSFKITKIAFVLELHCNNFIFIFYVQFEYIYLTTRKTKTDLQKVST